MSLASVKVIGNGTTYTFDLSTATAAAGNYPLGVLVSDALLDLLAADSTRPSKRLTRFV